MADADLQNYAGTPVWNDDLTAASTLLPVDGKKITADNNAAGRAPVNRSLKQLKQMLIGVHDGIFGSRSGSTRRTVKSLEVDGTGGAASTLPAGEIKALSNITTDGGDLIATTGAVTAAGIVKSTGGSLISEVGDLIAGAVSSLVRVGLSPSQRAELGNHLLRFLATGTGTGDANPPQGTAMPNQLRPINISKASAFVVMDVPNAVSLWEGHGISGATIVATSADAQAVGAPTHGIQLSFATAFSVNVYSVEATGQSRKTASTAAYSLLLCEDYALRTVNSCVLYALAFNPTTPVFSGLDPTTATLNFSVHVMGQQTT